MHNTPLRAVGSVHFMVANEPSLQLSRKIILTKSRVKTRGYNIFRCYASWLVTAQNSRTFILREVRSSEIINLLQIHLIFHFQLSIIHCFYPWTVPGGTNILPMFRYSAPADHNDGGRNLWCRPVERAR